MFSLRKLTVAALVTLAGAAGVLVAVSPGSALGQDAVGDEVTVLADSPWGTPRP